MICAWKLQRPKTIVRFHQHPGIFRRLVKQFRHWTLQHPRHWMRHHGLLMRLWMNHSRTIMFGLMRMIHQQCLPDGGMAVQSKREPKQKKCPKSAVINPPRQCFQNPNLGLNLGPNLVPILNHFVYRSSNQMKTRWNHHPLHSIQIQECWLCF